MVSFPVSDGPHNDDWKALLKPWFVVIEEMIRATIINSPSSQRLRPAIARRD